MGNSTATTHCIGVRITFDLDARQWVASAADLSLTVRAHNYPQARRRVRRLIEESVKGDFHMEEQVELPPVLAKRLRTYTRRHLLWRKLTAYVRHTRLSLAYDLLDLKMNQADVALLMDLSRAQLNALLERDTSCQRSSPREQLAAE